MKIILSFALLFYVGIANGQRSKEYAQVDEKILSLPVMDTYNVEGIIDFININFKTEQEKTRAIYVWVTNNLSYDVPNILAIDYSNKRKERIINALKYGRAVCQGYSELFDTLCNRCGIRSHAVEGYTLQGKTMDYVPHAWVAAYINEKWYLFDPTWGAGYINSNDQNYIKKFNENYFMVSPEKMIKTHMPFDPMWQLLSHTMNNFNFMHGNYNEVNKDFFNFQDSIYKYEKLNEINKLEATLRRMEKNEIDNSILISRYIDLKRKVEDEKQNQTAAIFNSAVNDYNYGTRLFNEYTRYKNKHFIPEKPDAEIRKMIVDAEEKLNLAKNKLNKIIYPESIANHLKTMNKLIDDLKNNLKEEREFLEKYFNTNKSKRKMLFTLHETHS